MSGSRVTDAIEFFRQREEHRHAVRLVRHRAPDAWRWRAAVARMSATVATLDGRSRTQVEEPLREVVVDLEDRGLRTEVVLDARQARVDWDRGEVLAPKTFGDLRRVAFLTGADVSMIGKHLPLNEDFFAPIDVAGVVVVGRTLAQAYRRRAQRLSLELPLVDDSSRFTTREKSLVTQIESDERDSRRWSALSAAMLEGSL